MLKYFCIVYHCARKTRNLLFVVTFGFLFLSCTKDEVYEAQLKSLDSISGALNQKLSELKFIDTVILKKAVTKYNNYRQFIQQNVNDTLSKDEGNQLQQFYLSGKNLSDFSYNRSIILARGSLQNTQLNKLILDVKAQSEDEEILNKFCAEEKQNAERLIKSTYGQQQLFQSNLQEFKLSLSGVEGLIRLHNNGQMPTIIKDSIPL